MKLSLGNNVWIVPENGQPVEGRMSVYLHDSNTRANLYYLEGESYAEAANPQLLHSGLPFSTMFVDSGVYDIVIERYIGEEGAMSVYSPDTDFEQVGDYESGLDFDPGRLTANRVDTMTDLQDVDPSVGAVTVMCYAEPGDCPPRTYVWDAACQNEPDGGYVVSSNVSDSGKWILMWDCDVLPCSVYGIKQGTEGNINLFIGYPDQVGSFGMRTAKRLRFLPGTYISNSYWSTSRDILFDAGAQFPEATFACPHVSVSGRVTGYVADFELTSPDAEAHSSWFRTATAFWFCGAKDLYIDSENFMADTMLRGNPSVTGAVIHGTSRIPMTYASGRYITLDGTALAGKSVFSPTQDFIKFAHSRWNDAWWTTLTPSSYDFGRISGGHHIEFLSVSVNTQELSDFGDTAIYVKMREAQIDEAPAASKVLDLEGRTLSSFSSSKFTAIMNCHITGNANLGNAPAGFVMQDVVVDGSINGGTNLGLERVKASINTEWTGSLYAKDCFLWGSPVTGAHDITVLGGTWRKRIVNATDNVSDMGTLIFRDCVLDGDGGTFHVKRVSFLNCGIYNQTIEIYPMWDAVNSRFAFNTRMEHCEVNCTVPVAYKIFHDLHDGCKDCVLACTWIGNSFFGNEKGLTMEFWADASVQANVLAENGHYVVYSGNSGNCPLEAWHGTSAQTSWVQCAFYPSGGDAPLTGFYRAEIPMRCCPDFSRSGLSYNTTYGNWVGPAHQISGNSTTKGFLAATDPSPSYIGYGDAFDSCIVRYGGAGDTTVIFV